MVTSLVVAGISAAATIGSSYLSKSGGDSGGGDYGTPAGQDLSAQAEDYRNLAEGYMESAVGTMDQRMAERRKAENRLKRLEFMLGSDAQISGFQDPTLTGYQNRYVKDKEALKGVLQGFGTGAEKRDYKKEYKWALGESNRLMQQSEDAIRAGRTDLANELQTRAQGLMQPYQDQGVATEFNTRDAPYGLKGAGKFAAKTKQAQKDEQFLSSPMAITAGEIVKRGRDLMDPNSEYYKDLMGEISGSATKDLEAARVLGERAIASERRQAEQDVQQFGMARGAGRSMRNEQAMMARVADTAATQRANLYLQTANQSAQFTAQARMWMEQFSMQMGAFSIDVGRNFLHGLPTIREEYQTAMDNLATASAQMQAQFANTALGASAQMASQGAGLTADYQAGMMNRDAALAGQRAGQQQAMIGQIGGALAGAAGGVNWGGLATGAMNLFNSGGTGVSTIGVGGGVSMPYSQGGGAVAMEPVY